MQIQIARSVRETSRIVSSNPANLSQATRTRKLRAKKKMSVPLMPQQKTSIPSIVTKKVVSTIRKTAAKTPVSRMQKNTKE